MRDLVAFLTARLDEDEQLARNCVGDDLGWLWTGSGGHVKDADGCAVVAVEDYGPEVVEHIARHDPARVLAECEAKRIIVAEHGRGEMFNDCRRCAPWETAPPYETPGTVDFPCRTLRALALPYADHPDYRQEWAL